MALASLCHESTFAKSDFKTCIGGSLDGAWRLPQFTGFIVDHKLRDNSGDEALKVANELEKLGITSRILELKWSGYDSPSSLRNLESVARRLRYQAIGRACRRESVTSLLLGHHADDQAETVLMRMVSGYTGSGLRGISDSAPLPECHGIHGVDHSGQDNTSSLKMMVEGGGVQLCRPLLHARKTELFDICTRHGVRWFDDHTNLDPTLTVRNAVRSMLRTEGALPRALQFPRLTALSENRSFQEDEDKATAKRLLDMMKVSLHLRSGQMTIVISKALREGPSQTQTSASSYALRQLVAAVSPRSSISLQDLGRAAALVFGCGESNNSADKQLQVAGVNVRTRPGQSTDGTFILSRTLPPSREVKFAELQLWSPQSASEAISEEDKWRLWDGRFWIRVHSPVNRGPLVRGVVVRFLNKDGYAQLLELQKQGLGLKCRDRMADVNLQTREGDGRDAVQILKSVARYDVRLTLPAIFVQRLVSVDEDVVEERLVALPSLDCYAQGWNGKMSGAAGLATEWQCEIRYKHVDLDESRLQDSIDGAQFID